MADGLLSKMLDDRLMGEWIPLRCKTAMNTKAPAVLKSVKKSFPVMPIHENYDY